MASPQQASPGATLQGLVVLLAIAGTLYFVGLIGFGGVNESNASPPIGSPVAERSPSIEPGLLAFKKGLPFLVDEGIREELREGNRHFVWMAGADSVASESSWVRFLDSGSDGTLDEIRAGLVFPDEPQAKRVAAMGTACRLVAIASRNRIDAEAIARWLIEGHARLVDTSKNCLSRVFGPVKADLSVLTMDGVPGSVILLTIRPSEVHRTTVSAPPPEPTESTARTGGTSGGQGSVDGDRASGSTSGTDSMDAKPAPGPRPDVMFVGYLHNVFTVGLRKGVAQVELRDLQGQLIEVKKMGAEGQFKMKHVPNVIRARVWIDDGPAETFTLAQGETQEPFAQRLRAEFENRVQEQRRAVYGRDFDK